MKVREIFDFLNELYPLHSAMEFDNPGLLVGDPEGEVSNILIALDCTMNTVKNAKNNACELIITHHPVIFSPLKKLLAGTVVFELIKSGISVISMHTNLDVAENGVNDFLCRTIGLTDTTLIAAADGFVLKGGRISPVTAQNFAKTLKAKLGGCVKYVDGGKPIEKVLVCCGSGGDYINDAVANGFDALVTADVKHHQFIFAAEAGISLFDAGHFNTEDVIIEPLRTILSEKFNNCEFFTEHPHLIQFE